VAQQTAAIDVSAVKEGARVIASDGPAGKVREVLIGDTAADSYLRVRTGGLFGKERYVAGYDVERVADDAVWLKITRHALEATTAQARPRAFVQGQPS
jgi:hypothetical protein